MAENAQPVPVPAGGLGLRPWRLSDPGSLPAAAGRDPAIRRWNLPLVDTPANARTRIGRLHERRRAESGAIWFAAHVTTGPAPKSQVGDPEQRRLREGGDRGQGADVSQLLEAASLLVPEGSAGENDITVRDVWEYLAHDEWEVALGLLEELAGARPLPLDFWQAMSTAAEQLRLERSAAWCHWRALETRIGIIRADLSLRPAAESRRRTPFSGAGVLRPMWNIGHRTPSGEASLAIASLWVEFAPVLRPGQRSCVRLAPLDPSRWQHVGPGQVITMHEDRTEAGTAVVLEVQGPATASVSGATAHASDPASHRCGNGRRNRGAAQADSLEQCRQEAARGGH
jgi:hypothetical protein